MDTYDLLFIFVLLLVNVMITEIEKKTRWLPTLVPIESMNASWYKQNKACIPKNKQYFTTVHILQCDFGVVKITIYTIPKSRHFDHCSFAFISWPVSACQKVTETNSSLNLLTQHFPSGLIGRLSACTRAPHRENSSAEESPITGIWNLTLGRVSLKTSDLKKYVTLFMT